MCFIVPFATEPKLQLKNDNKKNSSFNLLLRVYNFFMTFLIIVTDVLLVISEIALYF